MIAGRSSHQLTSRLQKLHELSWSSRDGLRTCVGKKPFEMITPHYLARHRVRPGITGLAQVRGLRGETETEQKLLLRVAADLEYIDHWSLWLDVQILLRTVAALFTAQNAY